MLMLGGVQVLINLDRLVLILPMEPVIVVLGNYKFVVVVVK
jgi:hypothetical protein